VTIRNWKFKVFEGIFRTGFSGSIQKGEILLENAYNLGEKLGNALRLLNDSIKKDLDRKGNSDNRLETESFKNDPGFNDPSRENGKLKGVIFPLLFLSMGLINLEYYSNNLLFRITAKTTPMALQMQLRK
jgi:hypothetical protein